MKTAAAVICVVVAVVVFVICFFGRRHLRRRRAERLIHEMSEIYREMEEYGVSTIEELEAVKARARQEKQNLEE